MYFLLPANIKADKRAALPKYMYNYIPLHFTGSCVPTCINTNIWGCDIAG